MKAIRIGCGAGYAGDRIDPAKELVKKGNLDYLILEGLAERTTAIAQLQKSEDADKGYGAFLEERMEELLPLCKEKGTTLITNLGAANPKAALKHVERIKKELKLDSLLAAAVTGSDVLEQILPTDNKIWETKEKLSDTELDIISADAYLGVEQILPALKEGADIIITGRVADPSLFLAAMVYEFSWELNDWHKLGKGTIFSHLLECAAQVTGGYFADTYYKQIDDLWNVGLPIVEINEDGEGFITKTPGTGGNVTVQTCKEQLLYEVMNPSEYITPDVTADFSNVYFTEEEPNVIRVENGSGRERTDTLKVTLGVDKGYLGEGMISYAGHHALERSKLAEKIIQERIKKRSLRFTDIKYELLGLNALHGSTSSNERIEPYEVLLRVAALAEDKYQAEQIGNEVESLWLNGPGGPGGVRKNTKRVISAYSTLIARESIESHMITKDEGLNGTNPAERNRPRPIWG
ncbi:acyclic terpene utilization AtuA family protein [Alteribacillus sp. HJP-4]|uniref:acyclic terpene utilization AtuA family protein n=1 Tax=Alteribacillus sp. HJP-4 TaxID=2775394 RepID=UPI0035CD3B9A